MLSKDMIVRDGLESRSAAHFVQNASRFKSHILVRCDERQVNAKSIMGIISLGILSGQTITLTAEGEDEETAIEVLSNFLK